MPGYTGNASFSPNVPFGFGVGGSFSDDGRNNGGVVAECTPPREHPQSHNFRFYPAENGASQVLDTWLVILDVKFIPQPDEGCPAYVKNYDYQDIVFLLKNARPELGSPCGVPGSPGPASTSRAPAGRSTTRTARAPASPASSPTPAGSQYIAANLDLDTAAGELRITSAAGTNTNQLNTQQNAVQTVFDATRDEFQVAARLEGPFGHINQGNEQQAVFFGPDQQNYFKVEVENFGGQPVLSAVVENNGSLAFVPGAQTVSVPGLATATTLDLFITGSYGNGTLRASYSLDGGPVTALGDPIRAQGVRLAVLVVPRRGPVVHDPGPGRRPRLAPERDRVRGGVRQLQHQPRLRENQGRGHHDPDPAVHVRGVRPARARPDCGRAPGSWRAAVDHVAAPGDFFEHRARPATR